MKVKVVEAMCRGLPVITTAHSRNGLPPLVAAECIDWDQFVDGGCRIPDAGGRRNLASLNSELERFSSERFRSEVIELWSALTRQ